MLYGNTVTIKLNKAMVSQQMLSLVERQAL